MTTLGPWPLADHAREKKERGDGVMLRRLVEILLPLILSTIVVENPRRVRQRQISLPLV